MFICYKITVIQKSSCKRETGDAGMEAFAEKVKTICDLFYRSVHIPIYVYVQEQCRYSPTKEPLAVPPHRYIEQLLAQKDSVFYTEYGACFGGRGSKRAFDFRTGRNVCAAKQYSVRNGSGLSDSG